VRLCSFLCPALKPDPRTCAAATRDGRLATGGSDGVALPPWAEEAAGVRASGIAIMAWLC
jgi:hypothetical protein